MENNKRLIDVLEDFFMVLERFAMMPGDFCFTATIQFYPISARI